MSYKDSTREQLLGLYESRGLPYVIDISTKLALSNAVKKEIPVKTRNAVIGKIAETVLELCIREFMKQHPKETAGWVVTNSMILKDVDNVDGDFMTEIDVVLFTHNKVYLFECKSYIGDKTIVGRGTIKREGFKDFDVFQQHQNHMKVFVKVFDELRKQDTHHLNTYQMASFIFDTGSVDDQREDSWKRFMPFLGTEGVFSMLSHNLRGEKVWNLEYAAKAVKVIESKREVLAKKHLAYVKSLKHNRRNKSGNSRS